MNRISKNIIFYITIVEKNKAENAFLRKAIHTVLPYAIVESIYNEEEAIQYFNNCPIIPHLIFLDPDMTNVSGRDTIDMIKCVNGLDKVPVVFLANLSDELQKAEFIKYGAGYFYSKPYKPQDLMNIVGSLNGKWLA